MHVSGGQREEDVMCVLTLLMGTEALCGKVKPSICGQDTTKHVPTVCGWAVIW